MKPLPIKLSPAKFINLTICAFISFISTTGALAQGDEKTVQHYQVEIAIYKNIKAPKSNEYILPVSSPRRDSKIIDLFSAPGMAAAKAKQYEVVADAELQLSDIVQKIIKSSRYKLLLHTAWRQPGLEYSRALPLWIKAGRQFSGEFISIDDKLELLRDSQDKFGDTGSTDLSANAALAYQARQHSAATGLYELEGKITIALSRYLHVYTDLVLRKPRSLTNARFGTIGANQLSDKNISSSKILDNYQLQEHRRMRSKTLHYLDSPEFSMLIMITPYN